jgi:hypothetical protein
MTLPDTSLSLTREDRTHLATMEKKLDHIRSMVQGVVTQYHTGVFLWGEGGTSKSFTVISHLQKLRAKYVYHNSRLTARGLVEALEAAPDDIHLIEDAETLFEDKKAPGVMRSALWSQSQKRPIERPVTWTALKTRITFVFTGGLIVISNANFAETIPEIRALKTRINVVHTNISNEEIFAKMKQICLDGYIFGDDALVPSECWEVAQFIISETSQMERPLDLRLLINGFRDYMQDKTGNSLLHWQDLLRGRMQEKVVIAVKRRSERKMGEAELAAKIYAKKIPYPQKIAEWERRSGLKGERSFYRALKRLS